MQSNSSACITVARASGYKSSCRTGQRRPVRQDAEPPRYWYPKFQEWLTLTEYAYLKLQK